MTGLKPLANFFAGAIVVLLSSVETAFGQPLFHSEQNWTVEIGRRQYGIEHLIQNPGGWQQTRIWIAGHPYHPERNLRDRSVFAVPGVTPLYVVHVLSRSASELCQGKADGGLLSVGRWIVLTRRLILPYSVFQPPLYVQDNISEPLPQPGLGLPNQRLNGGFDVHRR